MKLTFAAEDTIAGIICGLLVVGFTGRFFSLKLPNIIYTIAFAIYVIFIVLDIVNEFSDLTTHFGFIAFSILHGLIDLVISLTFISHFSKLNIPLITAKLVPFLQNESAIFYIGAYLVIGNVIWLCLYPFLD
jgi:hypothetical protein